MYCDKVQIVRMSAIKYGVNLIINLLILYSVVIMNKEMLLPCLQVSMRENLMSFFHLRTSRPGSGAIAMQ